MSSLSLVENSDNLHWENAEKWQTSDVTCAFPVSQQSSQFTRVTLLFTGLLTPAFMVGNKKSHSGHCFCNLCV